MEATTTQAPDSTGTALSRDEAKALLGLFSMPESGNRTYSGLLMLTPPNGQQLYISPFLVGPSGTATGAISTTLWGG